MAIAVRGRARIAALLLLLAVLGGASAGIATARAETLTIAVLKYGTVDWLIDVIKHHRLDEDRGLTLKRIPLANNNATQVALLGGEADIIVADWFWVLRQRALGGDFVFWPYSITLGAVMVPADSPIKTIADLEGKTIGVAGGPLDKSWLLLRASGLRLAGVGDLADTAKPVFAAPPLLNEQLIAGKVDAAVNYWHFAAALEAAGYVRLASVTDLMTWLGKESAVPLIGFVFSEKQARERARAYGGFAAAVRAAQDLLLTSDAEWQRLRPLMGAAREAEFITKRDRYREGLVFEWNPRRQQDAARIFTVLAELGGEALTGKGVTFGTDIFWQAPAQ